MSVEEEYRYLRLVDSYNDDYGIIRIKNSDVNKVLLLIEYYRNTDEDYDTDGFGELLNSKGICFELVILENVYF